MELLNKYRAFVIFTKYHNIDQQSIVKAAEYFELKYCEKGSYLFHEGDKSNYFYGIMSGRISMRHNIEVVKTILKTLDKPESLITYVSDRKGHDLRYAIDPTKNRPCLSPQRKSQSRAEAARLSAPGEDP